MDELQVENGNFTRIINVVLEKLALFPFPAKTGMPIRLALFVIRKTWGFNKKEDYISITQFEKALESNRPSVVHWLEYLVKANILVKGKALPQKGTLYRFNKYWEQWKWGVTATQLVKARKTGWLKQASKGSNVAVTHKRKKDNITKDIPVGTTKLLDEINKIFNIFYKINPNINYANKTERKATEWLINRYGIEKVISATEYALSIQNEPYTPTILTPLALKDKMAALAKYKTNNSKGKESKTVIL